MIGELWSIVTDIICFLFLARLIILSDSSELQISEFDFFKIRFDLTSL